MSIQPRPVSCWRRLLPCCGAWRIADDDNDSLIQQHASSQQTVQAPKTHGATPVQNKKIIISSGDISDVDGYFAVAEYAKTGSDLLFVMNYPAYIGVRAENSQPDSIYETENQGVGYRYSAKEVLANVPDPPPRKYSEFVRFYQSIEDDNDRVKAILTDLAHFITSKVWNESCSVECGKFFFSIGGINTINPFASGSIKFEPLVYCDSIPTSCPRLKSRTEGAVFDGEGRTCSLDLEAYSDIYMDFNGSMAFFSATSTLHAQLEKAGSRVRCAAIMGGVCAEEPPKTMPAIPGKLNRLSCATMNQLYHPAHSAAFFRFLSAHGIPAYLVTNNAVEDLTTHADAARTAKTYDGVDRFLRANGLAGAFLTDIARRYYEDPRTNPPRKPFDFYTARALAHVLRARADPPGARPRRLFYCDRLGVALASAAPDWPAARGNYVAGLDVAPADGDSEFVRGKKAAFRREAALLAALALPALAVRDLAFSTDSDTHRLAFAPRPGP